MGRCRVEHTSRFRCHHHRRSDCLPRTRAVRRRAARRDFPGRVGLPDPSRPAAVPKTVTQSQVRRGVLPRSGAQGFSRPRLRPLSGPAGASAPGPPSVPTAPSERATFRQIPGSGDPWHSGAGSFGSGLPGPSRTRWLQRPEVVIAEGIDGNWPTHRVIAEGTRRCHCQTRRRSTVGGLSVASSSPCTATRWREPRTAPKPL